MGFADMYKSLQWEFDRIQRALEMEKPPKKMPQRDTVPSSKLTAQRMDAIKKEVDAEETHPGQIMDGSDRRQNGMRWSDIFSGVPTVMAEDADAMASSGDLQIKAGKQLKMQADILKLQKRTADKRRDLSKMAKPIITPISGK